MKLVGVVGLGVVGIEGAVGLDRRIGPDHLTVTAERGFGGGCLPKDLDGFIAAARAKGYEPLVLAAIASFNRRVRGEDLDVTFSETTLASAETSLVGEAFASQAEGR